MTWRLDDHGCWVIEGRECYIWMAPRPAYCDRGNWLAHFEYRRPRTLAAGALQVDWQDNWPRYYFDLDRAKAEVEAWLVKRGQVTP